MRTHLEFASSAFPANPGEDKEINPGIFGKRLAEFLAEGLRKQGFKVLGIGSEDWGWMVEIENREFPLWIGCANYQGTENEFQCFIEPSKPFVRKWFSKIETGPPSRNWQRPLRPCSFKAESSRDLNGYRTMRREGEDTH